uniref:autotransporter family protein n=1 Tax=Castellaniella defragrans TaxID=75697 RepID=UPI0033403622
MENVFNVRRTPPSCAAIITAAIAAFSAPADVRAYNIDGLSITIPNGGNDPPNPWNIGEVLYVGNTGTGSLRISDNSLVTSTGGSIGDNPGSKGTVEVTSGATWNAGDFLNIGMAGTGEMTISGAGIVNSGTATIGNISTIGKGTVTVTGNGSKWNMGAGQLSVGASGFGQLTISDKGVVSNTVGYIGQNSTGDGTVEVTSGATWTNTTLYVGNYGIGQLTISTGGVVSNTNGYIGTYSGSTGKVEVTGNSTWTNTGSLAIGMNSGSSGQLTISNGGTVSNTDGYVGTHSTGTVEVTGSGSTWTNTGDLAIGYNGTGKLTVSNGGTVNAGTTFIAYTTNASGTLNIGAADGDTATAPGTLSASQVQFGSTTSVGTGTLVFNHTATANDGYTFQAPILGAGTVNVLAGATTLGGPNTYSGTTTVSGGLLKAGATGAFSAASDFVVGGGAFLDANGLNQTLASLGNSGTVMTGTAGSTGPVGATLTVAGNYTGDNGSLILRTALGGNGSATDRLNIQGTASGVTAVGIVNAGGTGDQTSGDGILIIQTGGSTADAFRLSDRVAAGAYDYNLHFGGDAATGGNPSDQNWYLRSTLAQAPTIPDYRAEFPLTASVLPIASEYGYAMLGTLHERVGAIWPAPNGAAQADRTRRAASGWMRLIGDRGSMDNGGFERHGPDYDYTFAGIQGGLDVLTRERADGTLDRAGFYAGYGNIDADAQDAWSGKAGNIRMDAYTLGGYWTHQSARGWYTDAVVQGTRYQADAKSVAGQKLSTNGFGILTSLEGGYGFSAGHDLTIEPQAQLAYQNLSFDDTSDAYGRFNLSDQESLRGRLGVRIARTLALPGAKPRLLSTWVRANVWHEFNGDARTTATTLDGAHPTTVWSSLGGTWGEIGAGVSGQITDAISLFVSASHNHSLDGTGRKAWNGRFGINMQW